MRAFCISLALLAVVTGLSLANFFYLANQTKSLLALAETLPTDKEISDADFASAAETLDEIRTFWENIKPILSLGIPYDNLIAVELALAESEAACLAAESADFLSARGALLLATRRLFALERSFF